MIQLSMTIATLYIASKMGQERPILHFPSSPWGIVPHTVALQPSLQVVPQEVFNWFYMGLKAKEAVHLVILNRRELPVFLLKGLLGKNIQFLANFYGCLLLGMSDRFQK